MSRKIKIEKKKLPAVKNLTVYDEKRTIKFMLEPYQGPIHDNAIWNHMEFDFRDLNAL